MSPMASAMVVSRSRVATSRLSHLEAEPLREATMWMERYKHFWTSSFDKLDVALAAFQANATRPAGDDERTDDERTDDEKGESR